jgi:hypothetical protein
LAGITSISNAIIAPYQQPQSLFSTQSDQNHADDNQLPSKKSHKKKRVTRKETEKQNAAAMLIVSSVMPMLSKNARTLLLH